MSKYSHNSFHQQVVHLFTFIHIYSHSFLPFLYQIHFHLSSVIYDYLQQTTIYNLHLSGFKSETFHTLFVLSNQFIAFSRLLAIEKKTLVTLLLLFQAHTAWFWFLLFV